MPCPCQRDFGTVDQLCFEGGKIQFGGNGFTLKPKMLSLLAKLKTTSCARKDDCLPYLQCGGHRLWSRYLTVNQEFAQVYLLQSERSSDLVNTADVLQA